MVFLFMKNSILLFIEQTWSHKLENDVVADLSIKRNMLQ